MALNDTRTDRGLAIERSEVAVGERSATTVVACLFHAMGDRSRLTILQHLLLGEHRVVDLTAHLGLAQSTVSKHLACLRNCGLVDSRPDGRASVFFLTRPEQVRQVFAAAEHLLTANGDAVRPGPTSRGVTTSRDVA